MPLTHVCMWSSQSWKKITAYEAAQLFPNGASAHSGLFMCELCGQYVSLTNGTVQSRHFRHSAKEQNKDCEDRSDIYSYSYYFRAEAHDLPIRIKIINNVKFTLEMGFIPVAKETLTELSGHFILIDGGNETKDKYTYSTDRILPEQVNYLSIGSVPQKEYRVTVRPDVDKITSYWPSKIEGIDPKGTIFDGKTGKKLQYDSDVVVNREYLMMIGGYGLSYPSDLLISEKCAARVGSVTWRIYSVVAKSFSEKTAKFFLDHHCRLTDEPVKMYPIWPMHVSSPYVVFHNAKEMYIYFNGNAETNLAPHGSIKPFPSTNPKVLLISSSERQQLLSAGRTRVLKYTYFWHRELKQKASLPAVKVKDFNGDPIDGGILSKLPAKRTIIIIPQVDGFVEIINDGVVVERYKLICEKEFLLDNINLRYTIKIYQGCDIAWSARFVEKTDRSREELDDRLMQKLVKCTGPRIDVTQSTYGVFMKMLKDMPKTKRWLYTQNRKRSMTEQAYKILMSELRRK